MLGGGGKFTVVTTANEGPHALQFFASVEDRSNQAD